MSTKQKRETRQEISLADRHRRVLRLAESGGDDVDKLVRRFVRLIRSVDHDARDYVQSEITLARRAARRRDADGSLHRLAALAEWILFSSMPEVASSICGLGANLASTFGEDPVAFSGRANLLNVVGLMGMNIGEYTEARRLFTDARDLAERGADPELMAATLLNLTNVERIANDFVAADRWAETALDLYRANENDRGQAQLLQTLGNIAIERGHVDEANRWADEAEPLVRSLRDPGVTSGYHHLRARVSGLRGEAEDAERSYQAALAAARRSGSTDKQVACLQNLGAWATETDRHSVARRRLRAAVDLADRSRLYGRLLDTLPALIRSEIANQNPPGAVEAAQRYMTVATDLESHVAEAHALLGASLIDNDRLPEGIEELEAGWRLLQPEHAALDLKALLVRNLIVAHGRAGDLAQFASDHADRAAQLAEPAAAAALEELGLTAAQDADTTSELVERILLESLARRPNRQRAWSSILIASHLERLQMPLTAAAVLRVGYAASRRSRQHTLVKQVRNDLALALIQSQDYPEALQLLAQNLGSAESEDDSTTARLAHINLSEAYRRLDSPAEAEDSAREALRLADQSGDGDALAEARLQLALALMDQDQFSEAKGLLDTVASGEAPADEIAAALSSMGSLALGEGDPATAIRYYRHALRAGERAPRQRAETLLGLTEALASDNNRRAYLAALQRSVDALREVKYDGRLAARFVRCAQTWDRHGKTRFAGEALAVAVLVGAAQYRTGDDHFYDQDSPLMAGLVAAAVALHQGWAFDGDPRVIAAFESELRRHLSKKAVRALMKLIDDLTIDPIDHLAE